MGKSIARCKSGSGLHTTAPSLIGTMSFRLTIPWRVALPQSPPPLHQPSRIVRETLWAVQSKSSEQQTTS